MHFFSCYQRLPIEDKQLLQRWLVNLKRTTLPSRLDRSYVCSDHFEPECFGRDIRAELMGKRPKPPLLKGSVPTLFSYNNFKSKIKKRVVSEERKKRKEKEEVLKELLGPHFYMKPSAPPNTQVVKRESPMELEDVDNKFSIQSLLPEFACACAYNSDTCTDTDQTRTSYEHDVSISKEQIPTGTESNLGTVNEQAQTETGIDVSTNHEQLPTDTQELLTLPSICNGKKSSNGTMITYNMNATQGQTEKWVIVLLKCKEGTRVKMNFGRILNRQNKPSTSEASCQTEEELVMEVEKPSKVSVQTQWDKDDFLPNLELVQRDHTYSNPKRVS
ncbi:THAP domain-containing protein 5-like isoform X2 [Stylophora pistillata]|uniref:THAP domain-containing protein 5-like isoform X2 n=1 Tax=Stylophora pistillata TaxID=50429 RepID=UPI000C049F84|nr:THAP domain-containing protein 5-like isoform X2 [Stylophora pistillata]